MAPEIHAQTPQLMQIENQENGSDRHGQLA
jgi:hypothetical protein